MARFAFVTGATGFIGRHLVDQLIEHGWTVRALVRPSSDSARLQASGAEVRVGDLSDPARLAAFLDGSDTVFHLAAVTAARSHDEYERANAEGTRTVVEAVRRARVRPRSFVYLSSYAAVGPAFDGVPRSAHAEPAPLTAYGRTKLAGERIAAELNADGVEVLVVRAPAVYGPGDRALLPFFRFVRWGLAPGPGGGDRRLQLVYAPDLARALRRAADAGDGVHAVADPREYRWGEIVDQIAAAMDRRPLRIALPPRLVRAAATATEVVGRLTGRAVSFNREKAEELLAPAWTCELSRVDALLPADDTTPLREGLESTIRWYIRQGWL